MKSDIQGLGLPCANGDRLFVGKKKIPGNLTLLCQGSPPNHSNGSEVHRESCASVTDEQRKPWNRLLLIDSTESDHFLDIISLKG